MSLRVIRVILCYVGKDRLFSFLHRLTSSTNPSDRNDRGALAAVGNIQYAVKMTAKRYTPRRVMAK